MNSSIDLTYPPRIQLISKLENVPNSVDFIRIDSGDGYIDGVFKRATNSDKLVVLFPAALPSSALSERKFPYIPRWQWVSSIPSNVWCFEEVIARKYNILASWFQEKNFFFADVLSEVINDIAKNIGVKKDNIVLAGSSLGGFGALMVSPLLPGSRVVADICQTNLSTYQFRRHVEDLCDKIYDSRDVDGIINDYPDRFIVMKRFEKIGYIPDMTILHELTDEPNGSQQIYPFFQNLSTLRNAGLKEFNIDGLVRSKGNGHVAMQREEFISFL